MKRALLPLIVLALLCTAFGPRQLAAARHTPLSLATIVRTVGERYGDPRPHIVRAQKTWTESTPQLMYIVELSGQFRRGQVRARYLYFSALVNRPYVWGVQGYDSRHHLQWLDRTLPKG